MTFTLIIIIITSLISISAFNNRLLTEKLILWPRFMDRPGEYYRLLTSGFIHADWMHLIFNMFTLYWFGTNIEALFTQLGVRGLFVVMYLTAIIVSSLPSFLKNRNNSHYRSLGASGGVAAALFATIYYAPWATIYIYFIPVPSIIFAVLYLGYSAYMSRKGADNVNHGAHLWGSVYGFAFSFMLDPTHGKYFIDQLTHFHL